MNKDESKQPAPQDHETIDVTEQPSGDIYYFPNEGGITSFSVKADSRKEAEERNAEHLKQLQKENT